MSFLDGGPGYLVLLLGAGFGLGHVAWEAGVDARSPTRLFPTAERLFAKIGFGYLIVSWMGVVLAELGWLGPRSLLAVTVVAALAVGLGSLEAQRLGWRNRAVDLGYSPAVLVLLVAAAAYLYFPPVPTWLAARDPAIYQLSGAHLAREGSWVIHDEAVAELGLEMEEYLFPSPMRGESYDWGRYAGFQVEEVEEARVVPQGLPVFPVWVAVGYWVAGPEGGLSVAPLLALLGAIALYYLGHRLVHPVVGAAAAVLLAVNFTQAWFARYGAAETAAQVMVLTGLYALLMQRRHGDRFYAVLAGAALGMTLLTKAELALLLPGLYVLLISDLCRGEVDRDAWLGVWIPLGALTAHAGIQAVFFSWPYVSDLLVVVHSALLALLVAGALALAVVLGVARWTRGWDRRRLQASGEFLQGASGGGRALRWAVSFVLVAMFAYGYWFRPLIPMDWNVRSLPELGWQVSTPLLFLALAGTLLFLHERQARRGAGAILAVALAGSIPTLIRPLIIPELLWSYRRNLPVLLPTTLLLAAYAGWRIWSDGGRWLELRTGNPRLARGAMALVLVVLAAPVGLHTARMTERYLAPDELAGSREILAEVEAAVEPDAVLLFEPGNRLGLSRLQAPLSLLEGHRVLRLDGTRIRSDLLAGYVNRQAQQDRSVYLLTSGLLGFTYTGPIPAVEPVARFGFELAHLESIMFDLPTETVVNPVEMAIWRLLPGGRAETLAGELDVGTWDDLFVNGFHAPEVQQYGSRPTFRWTREMAELWLPGLGPEAGRVVLTLGVGEDRPAEVGPPMVAVSLDDLPMGTVEVATGWADYELPVPDGWRPGGAPPRLRLQTTAWSPADHGFPRDTRELGVKVDAVVWGAGEAGGGVAPDRPAGEAAREVVAPGRSAGEAAGDVGTPGRSAGEAGDVGTPGRSAGEAAGGGIVPDRSAGGGR